MTAFVCTVTSVVTQPDNHILQEISCAQISYLTKSLDGIWLWTRNGLTTVR
jgi:hypothetical protein